MMSVVQSIPLIQDVWTEPVYPIDDTLASTKRGINGVFWVIELTYEEG
jgi:hypothetical protein